MVLKEKTDTHPVEERSRVEDEGDHEGSRPQNFAPLWELQLQEPAEGNTEWPSGTLHTTFDPENDQMPVCMCTCILASDIFQILHEKRQQHVMINEEQTEVQAQHVKSCRNEVFHFTPF